MKAETMCGSDPWVLPDVHIGRGAGVQRIFVEGMLVTFGM